jgi:hypothetical protein
MYPFDVDVNQTLFSACDTPLVWLGHVSPPFVVCRIFPDAPTTAPLFASNRKTPLRELDTPLDCALHP